MTHLDDPYTLLFTWHHSELQQASGGWQFDPLSFALGVLVTVVLVSLAYRYRAVFARFRDRASQKARELRQRLTANMATRYSNDVIEHAQGRHLFGGLASLDEIFVSPRLYAPLEAEENANEGHSLSLDQALRANPRLCLMGPSGSGRSTLLNHFLLTQARRIRATEGNQRVPVYVYLPVLTREIAAEPMEASQPVEPSQMLVDAALSAMSRLVATGVARWLLREVKAGNGILLLDGWDEVPERVRPGVTAWIQALGAAQPDNRLVVASGDRGYAPLIEAGFVPLGLAPWRHQQFTQLTQRWIGAWPGQEGAIEAIPKVAYGLEPPTPLEATLDLVVQLRGQAPAATPAERLARVMDLLLPPPEMDEKGGVAWPLETGHRALGHLALVAFEQDMPIIQREQIQDTVTEAMPATQVTASPDGAGHEARNVREEEELRTLQIVDCCRDLTASGGPIRSWDRQSFFFAHHQVASYLAARHLVDNDLPVLAHAQDSRWSAVLRFYAGLAPAEAIIDSLLSAPDDIFMSRLWSAAELMANSTPSQTSRHVKLIKRLAQLMMTPGLPELLRERSLHALVGSGAEGIDLLFKKMARHPEPALRANAILGLGGLRSASELPLMEAALGDEETQVQLAAVHALTVLARMENEKAQELLIAAVIETGEEVQREAAAALAQLGGEGYAVLKEAARDQDLMVRRAAVYGLALVDQPWALELLERMRRDDKEWLVRNAAAETLARLQAGDDPDAPPLQLTLPEAEAEPWLIAWAAQRGEGTGVGDAALATLTRALAEGDASIRAAATEALWRLADPRTIDDLRAALRDEEPMVRDLALTALDEISRRHDLTIERSR